MLSETLLSAFPGLDAEVEGGDTVLSGCVPDRSALHGVLAQIEALGLELLELRQTPASPSVYDSRTTLGAIDE